MCEPKRAVLRRARSARQQIERLGTGDSSLPAGFMASRSRSDANPYAHINSAHPVIPHRNCALHCAPYIWNITVGYRGEEEHGPFHHSLAIRESPRRLRRTRCPRQNSRPRLRAGRTLEIHKSAGSLDHGRGKGDGAKHRQSRRHFIGALQGKFASSASRGGLALAG
jgi:hypothetical protein